MLEEWQTVKPDQMQNMASDLVYTVCSGLSDPVFRVIMVISHRKYLKIEQVCMISDDVSKYIGWMANNLAPDQTAP